jgi:hypothetical protein
LATTSVLTPPGASAGRRAVTRGLLVLDLHDLAVAQLLHNSAASPTAPDLARLPAIEATRSSWPSPPARS